MNIIFQLLKNLVNHIYFFIGDWGTTIIIITVLIRLFMLPLSFKQKVNMDKQQVLSRKVEEIKSKYKNDKEKMEQEMAGLSAEGAKNMMGCLVTLVQLPVMYTLYRVFTSMPIEVGSVIVPWIVNMKTPDTYYIIPVISAFVQLIPNFLVTIGAFRTLNLPKATTAQMVMTAALNLIFLAKAPVTIGIYWIVSGLFSMIEQIAYGFYKRRKCLT